MSKKDASVKCHRPKLQSLGCAASRALRRTQVPRPMYGMSAPEFSLVVVDMTFERGEMKAAERSGYYCGAAARMRAASAADSGPAGRRGLANVYIFSRNPFTKSSRNHQPADTFALSVPFLCTCVLDLLSCQLLSELFLSFLP